MHRDRTKVVETFFEKKVLRFNQACSFSRSQDGFIMTEILNDDEKENTKENAEKFSKCSIKNITINVLEKITSGTIDNCFEDLPIDPNNEPEVALCGNSIVEPGEECDCGMGPLDCNDECCYPAHISSSDRVRHNHQILKVSSIHFIFFQAANKTAIPCSRTTRYKCMYPTSLVFGLYLPFTVIFLSIVVIAFFLRRDWKNDKRCFTHITQGNVRIVRPT